MLDLDIGVMILVGTWHHHPLSCTPDGSSGELSHQYSELTVPRMLTMIVGYGSTPQWVLCCTNTHEYSFVAWLQENYKIMKQFIVLRSSLIPYSYSNARTAYDEGTCFCPQVLRSQFHAMVLSQDLVCCGQCTMNFLKVQKRTPLINRLLAHCCCCGWLIGWLVSWLVCVCVCVHARVHAHLCNLKYM